MIFKIIYFIFQTQLAGLGIPASLEEIFSGPPGNN